MYRWVMVGAVVAGVLSLIVSVADGRDNVTTGLNVGFLLFITTVITFGVIVAMFGILRERQDHSRLFVLSLPISAGQYALAKVTAAVAAFVIPWSLLTAGVLGLTIATGQPTDGLPFFLALMLFFLCNFCLLTAVVVVTMSEVWAIVGILVTNTSVTLFVVNIAAWNVGWDSTLAAIVAAELTVALSSIAMALYVPSRRHDVL
jgi:ABC-type transport system involved in multi-copper enzyme maturation permease subunit